MINVKASQQDVPESKSNLRQQIYLLLVKVAPSVEIRFYKGRSTLVNSHDLPSLTLSHQETIGLQLSDDVINKLTILVLHFMAHDGSLLLLSLSG